MSFATRRKELMSRLGLRLAHSASKKRKTWWDNFLTRMLRDAIADPTDEDDFMQDELVNAEIEFDPEELEAYERNRDST